MDEPIKSSEIVGVICRLTRNVEHLAFGNHPCSLAIGCFRTFSNFTPYIGLNASSFLGFQSDTNYGANGHGLYGVGGPETFVKCLGMTPNLGFFINSGFFKGYGFSIENLILACDNDHNRSMTEGYKADFNIIQYRLDYRISF